MVVKKIPKRQPFYSFSAHETGRIFFSFDIRFSQYKSSNNFFQLYLNFQRYIQSKLSVNNENTKVLKYFAIPVFLVGAS